MTEEKKSMVPKLRFPGFNETWEQRELSSLSELITKGTSPLGNGNDGDINFIKVENLDSFSGKILSCSKVSKEEHLTYLRRSILYKGDILFSIAGTLGRTAIVPEDILPANTNQALAIIRTKNQDPRFLFTALKSRTVTDFIKKNPTVGAQPNLSLAQVGSLKIPYPSRAEQEKIGEFFSQLDTTITLHQRKLEGLSKLKKSLLQKMFPKNGQQNPELRFPGFTEAWEQRKFQEITQRVSTSSISSIDFPSVEYEDIEAGSGTLNKDVKLKEKNKKGTVFNKNDILFGKLRPYLMNWLLADFKGVAVGDFWVLRSQNCDPKFVYSLIHSKSFQEVANRSSGSKMPRADWNLVSNTLFFVPSQNNEQRKIGELFSSLDKVITLHQRKLESLKKLKKSLLQQMLV